MDSDLAGESMRFSERGSPTVNPFKLDAMICARSSTKKGCRLGGNFTSKNGK